LTAIWESDEWRRAFVRGSDYASSELPRSLCIGVSVSVCLYRFWQLPNRLHTVRGLRRLR